MIEEVKFHDLSIPLRIAAVGGFIYAVILIMLSCIMFFLLFLMLIGALAY